jgi:hypothetical protein
MGDSACLSPTARNCRHLPSGLAGSTLDILHRVGRIGCHCRFAARLAKCRLPRAMVVAPSRLLDVVPFDALSLDIATEITHTVVFNFVPGFQIFFSMLYGVPLVVAVSLQNERRIRSMTRMINALLSAAIGAVLYLQIFTILTVSGSKNPDDALLIARMFDGIDLFLAAAATIRWLGSNEFQEYSFFRILSIFLWINAALPAIHNRILLHYDYIWLDLFISAPMSSCLC